MICMTSPRFDLGAGEVARARISSATVRGCQATLSFVDENFLPIHFNVKGTACQGSLEVELAITIPREVPNGEAYLAWVCAGDSTPSCAAVYLTGGQSDTENLGYTQPAVLSCVPPQSTLSTVTRGAATLPTRSFSLQSTVSTHSAWTSTITSADGTVTDNHTCCYWWCCLDRVNFYGRYLNRACRYRVHWRCCLDRVNFYGSYLNRACCYRVHWRCCLDRDNCHRTNCYRRYSRNMHVHIIPHAFSNTRRNDNTDY